MTSQQSEFFWHQVVWMVRDFCDQIVLQIVWKLGGATFLASVCGDGVTYMALECVDGATYVIGPCE